MHEAVADLLHLFLDDFAGLLRAAHVGVDAVFELDEAEGVFGGHAQRVGAALGAWHDAFGELGVEEDEVFHRHADALVDLVEAHAVAHHDGVGAVEQQAGVLRV